MLLPAAVTVATTRAEQSSAICLFAALGFLAPRLILLLMWLFKSSFMLQPFAGMAVPNPVLPIASLLLLPTTTLGFYWASSAFGGVSSFSGKLLVTISVIVNLDLVDNGRGMAQG